MMGGGWLGSEVVYRDGVAPHVKPLLAEHKERLYEMEQPDLRANFLKHAWAFDDYCREKIRQGYEFEGRPLAGVGGFGVEPPFCLAYVLRGATQALIDMCEDPDYFHRLMDFVTEAHLRHRRYVNAVQNAPAKSRHASVGDDPIEMISVADYNTYVYPYHKRVMDELAGEGPHFAHLCGRAQHHFANLRERFNVWGFDTGFPTDLGRARRELGPGATFWGNIHVHNLKCGTKESIEREARSARHPPHVGREPGTFGGRFVLGDGNNVAAPAVGRGNARRESHPRVRGREALRPLPRGTVCARPEARVLPLCRGLRRGL